MIWFDKGARPHKNAPPDMKYIRTALRDREIIFCADRKKDIMLLYEYYEGRYPYLLSKEKKYWIKVPFKKRNNVGRNRNTIV